MFGKIEMGLILFYCLVNLVIIILASVFNSKKFVINLY